MSSLKTTLLVGPTPSPTTLLDLKASMGVAQNATMVFMVYQIEFCDELYYCCWSGGELKGGEPCLTAGGQAALEALGNLNIGSNQTLIVKHLRLGPTPLRQKVEATLRLAPPESKICFFGDMQGELDGVMEPAFNVQPGYLRV
ncbi:MULTISPECIES: hypothetical protein [Pseudomonas syringae group]|uniref:hypothetical protein n=1 Tax=Pseudomonas syringae group TaxID=136849 RepID=UPI0011C416C3|nr:MULTISPECIES: hypothetical protein [Pseudomonas syringae group]MDH4602360.1 hypothetical protein [Pseudomonas syringae pv. papulans]